ncbi:MAG TPA: rhodanese-like domain-containing protein [Actinocrinis sp.]|nr:rhodanese-like domain-containing protein [Actinocrinis sp.]
MKPQRLTLAVAADPAGALDPAVGVFHRFIQRSLVEGRLLDVADYRHVPNGPGVLLVGQDVDYGINPHAFTVTMKRRDDDAATQFTDAVRMALGTIDAIEADGALPCRFDATRMRVSVPDRRLGTHAQIQAALLADIAPAVEMLFGPDAAVDAAAVADPRRAPEISVRAASADGVLAKLGGSQATGQSPWDISARELRRLRESGSDLVLLDVREEHEYATVNIGGTLIPLGQLDDRLAELDPSSHVIAHCRAGYRGAQAVAKLRAAGFENAWNVNGGLMAWIDHVDPTLPRY